MTDGYNFIACAKRVGGVLLGRVEPSVIAVSEAAKEIAAKVPVTVRDLWNSTVDEGVPPEFADLLARLPSDGGNHAPH